MFVLKILHTADWHIGKLVFGIRMTEDQEYILNQMIDFVKYEKPDVIIISGDLYDRSIPQLEGVELLNRFFSEIILNTNTKIIAISGNHDSPDRVDFGSRILQEKGLYIRGKFSGDIEPIVMEDEYGKVNFFPIPFVEPPVLRELYEDKSISNYDHLAKKIFEKLNCSINYDERNICIFHGFLVGGEKIFESDSERPLSIGGTDYIDVEYFKDFDYVALGHLHKGQRVKHDHIRYSGSLLKYSFSEASHKKHVNVVNLKEKGNIEIGLKEFKPLRDMRIIKGKLNNLIHKDVYSIENPEDYIMAILTDEEELYDPMATLRSVYPNVMKLEKEKNCRQNIEFRTSAGEDISRKTPLEMFCEFYENISGEDFDKEKENIVAEIINDIVRKERNS